MPQPGCVPPNASHLARGLPHPLPAEGGRDSHFTSVVSGVCTERCRNNQSPDASILHTPPGVFLPGTHCLSWVNTLVQCERDTQKDSTQTPRRHLRGSFHGCTAWSRAPCKWGHISPFPSCPREPDIHVAHPRGDLALELAVPSQVFLQKFRNHLIKTLDLEYRMLSRFPC